MAKKNKKSFREYMESVPALLSWVDKQDVSGLRRFLLDNPTLPLLCISSGGSSSSAIYVSMLYAAYKGMAKAVSPLMLSSVSDEVLAQSKLLILSKSGKGGDAEYIAQRAMKVNPDATACITRLGDDNYLVKRLKQSFGFDWEDETGSFIATLSPFAMFGLCYKAFVDGMSITDNLSLNSLLTHKYTTKSGVGNPCPYNKICNYMVLYAGWSEPVAFDFESKMVETGYASVQLCDYRNFTHGRFIFLSHHLENSVLVLFITPREKEFVRQLIYEGKDRGGNALFPADIQIITVETEHDSPLASIDLLMKESMFFAEIGDSFGYDPCAPKNPAKIDKRGPKNIRYKGWLKMGSLRINTEDLEYTSFDE